jgi:hypothetical protein
MLMRRIPLSALLLGLTACIEGLTPARERTGFISAVTFFDSTAVDVFRVQYLGAFYRYDGLSTDIGTLDNCIPQQYVPQGPTIAFLPTLDAGAHVLAQLSGREDTLQADDASGLRLYRIPGTSNTVAFIPGDTLTMVIPGGEGGFPGMTVRVRTAEPFTFDPVGDPPEGQPLAITWTAATEPGSVIAFNLRFSNNSVDTIPNTQIRCLFVDDGNGQVDAVNANFWAGSDPASREVAVERIRRTTVQFDARTSVTLLSYFDRPLLPAP